jgi:hypothetical protein
MKDGFFHLSSFLFHILPEIIMGMEQTVLETDIPVVGGCFNI